MRPWALGLPDGDFSSAHVGRVVCYTELDRSEDVGEAGVAVHRGGWHSAPGTQKQGSEWVRKPLSLRLEESKWAK